MRVVDESGQLDDIKGYLTGGTAEGSGRADEPKKAVLARLQGLPDGLDFPGAEGESTVTASSLLGMTCNNGSSMKTSDVPQGYLVPCAMPMC